MNKYTPREIEPKWQKKWEKSQIYATTEDSTKPKRYVLEYFPYPSGAAMHVGHVRNYTIGDAMARFYRMQGFNVMHPMGWDAFGLPAENYAIKNNISPERAIAENTAKFKQQLTQMGFSYDWSREINSSDPRYYKWTQWLFILLLNRGLAYQKDSLQWWCETDKTVLANEQVESGKCWRCGNAVTKKPLKQWFFKITDYADRLVDDLESLDWSESIKSMQRNWIGKSQGAEITFNVQESINYVLLHGYTGSSKDCFFPWLSEKLTQSNASVFSPDLPNTDNPNADVQAEYVLNNTEFSASTVLLGHSYGAVTALKVLEKLDTPIKRLVLVAGFVQPGFLDAERKFENTTNWEFNFDKIKRNVEEIVILRANNDSIVPADRADYIYNNIGGRIIDFDAHTNHVCGTVEPVVLEYVTTSIKVFTTRPDTLFGATFMVLAPEHPLVQKITTKDQRKAVDTYIAATQKKSDVERQETDREKTGVFTGAYAINPVNNVAIPIWIADYVLYGYGTGAIMAVPAHDKRDYEFAKKFDLPIIDVVAQDFGTYLPDSKDVTGSVVVVYDQNTKKFLGIKTGTNDGLWLPGGGSESGESFEATAMRELAEETGFHKYQKMVALGEPVYSYYFNDVKDVNKRSYGQGFLFFVDAKDQGKTNLEKHETFQLGWYDYDQIIRGVKKVKGGVDHWLEMLRRAKQVIDGHELEVFCGEGILVNSGVNNGTSSSEARESIVADLEKKGVGKEVTNYKIRDWLISRQRYWGAPIPIIHCASCGAVPVPLEQLPVQLPPVKSYQPTGEGTSVLASVSDWVNVACPTCGKPAERETDTMDGFACSSWYFLRFADPHNSEAPFSAEKAQFWLPVDDYIGGAEHAVMHLLYARMWTKVMYDAGLITFDEPFKALRNHGMILAPDGRKMSKSWGNVIAPDELIDQGYGADAIRIMELFIGPWNQEANWSVEGMGGCYRFLNRVWTLTQEYLAASTNSKNESGELLTATHKAIKKVTIDMHNMGFNTAIAALMEYVNELYIMKAQHGFIAKDWGFALATLMQLLAPFAPHISEELWHQLGNDSSVHVAPWPEYQERYLVEHIMKIAVQVNGKLRGEIEVEHSASKEAIEQEARMHQNVATYIKSDPKKVIYVPKKLINFVV